MSQRTITWQSLFQALIKDEAGQAYAEYFLVVSVCVIGIGASFTVFNDILGGYYKSIVEWITLPLP